MPRASEPPRSIWSRSASRRTPHGLSRSGFIGFGTTNVMLEALKRLGLRNSPELMARRQVQWELVKQAIGFAPESARDAGPRIRRVLNALEPLTFPNWLTTHRNRNTSRRVRRAFDMVATFLASG